MIQTLQKITYKQNPHYSVHSGDQLSQENTSEVGTWVPKAQKKNL